MFMDILKFYSHYVQPCSDFLPYSLTYYLIFSYIYPQAKIFYCCRLILLKKTSSDLLSDETCNKQHKRHFRCVIQEKTTLSSAGKGRHRGQTTLTERKEKLKLLILVLLFHTVHNFVMKRKNRRKESVVLLGSVCLFLQLSVSKTRLGEFEAQSFGSYLLQNLHSTRELFVSPPVFLFLLERLY